MFKILYWNSLQLRLVTLLVLLCLSILKPYIYLAGNAVVRKNVCMQKVCLAQVVSSASAGSSPKHPDSPGTSECLSLSPLNVGSPSAANPHSPGTGTITVYKVICITEPLTGSQLPNTSFCFWRKSSIRTTHSSRAIRTRKENKACFRNPKIFSTR